MPSVLLVPTSDYLGHPFLQRNNHIFDRINRFYDVHVVRFTLFPTKQLTSSVEIHQLREISVKPIPLYYLINIFNHGFSISDIARKVSADIVVLSNLAPALGYLLIPRKKFPVVFDLLDFFPASAVGYISEKNGVISTLFEGAFSVILKWIIRRCNVVTVASHALIEYARSIGASNVIYVPNGISKQFFEIDRGEEIRSNFGFSDDDIVVGYLGSFEFWLDMEPLLDAIEFLIKSGLPVKMLMVGGGLHTGYVVNLKSSIERRNLKDYVFWAGFVPYEDVPKYIAAMDLATLPFNIKNLTAYYAGPNKLWEYLSQGKPTMATPIPEVLLNADFLEVVCTADDYIEVIQEYHKDRSEMIKKAYKGMKKARTLTWDKSARIMQEVLRTAMEPE